MESDEQRRVRPSERFAGAEHLLDIAATLADLRREPLRGDSGHRQIALVHEGPVRLVLFAFEAGSRMKEHAAPGWVTIHVLRGTLTIRSEGAEHQLSAGNILSLAPRVRHDVEATSEVDMLLGIYPESKAVSSTE